MRARFQIMGLFLSIAMLCASPGVHAIAFAATPPVHPAGCHSRRPVTPSHAPVSYLCCANGHNAAIPSTAFSSRPFVAQIAAPEGSVAVPPASLSAHYLEGSVTHTNRPPGAAAPLRI